MYLGEYPSSCASAATVKPGSLNRSSIRVRIRLISCSRLPLASVRREKVNSSMLSAARFTVSLEARSRLSLHSGIIPSIPAKALLRMPMPKRSSSSWARNPLKSMYIYSQCSLGTMLTHSCSKPKTSIPGRSAITTLSA